jgi:hypothetical protein
MRKIILGMTALVLAGALGARGTTRSAWAHEDGPKRKGAWSLVSDTNVWGDGDDYAGIYVGGRIRKLTFEKIQQLSTDFYVETGDCGGGSPRFEVALDTDDDGEFDGNVFVYLGPAPSFSGCPTGVWTSSGNLVPAADGRWDGSQIVPGTQISSHAALSALFGDATVLDVSLVVDGGWAVAGSRQVIRVAEAVVNGRTLDKAFGAATKLPHGHPKS